MLPTPRPSRRALLTGAVSGLAGLAVSGCSSDDSPAARRTTSPSATAAPTPSVDPDQPTGWGPTVGELDDARALVADWSPEQLAGQVIVGRYAGHDPEVPAQLVRDLHLSGVCVTSDNVSDADQVRATTAAIARAVTDDGRDFGPVIGVDEEGGVVEHLRGIATEFPAFADAGLRIEEDPRSGRRIVREAATATGLELRDFGFTWVFAPDADVTIGPADITIGSRSPSGDPAIAAQAVAAAVHGYNAAGIVSTAKHFPGHGAVTVDSHYAVPVRDASLAEVRAHDLPPFVSAVKAGAPVVMVGHIDTEAIDPGLPASLSPKAYDFLRQDLGFQGLIMTDSLGMGAVATTGLPALTALRAGADLLLMPANTAGTHETVTRAVKRGDVPRARIEQAAAYVVAVQRWQQRTAERVQVPADVTARAESAAAALSGAGS